MRHFIVNTIGDVYTPEGKVILESFADVVLVPPEPEVVTVHLPKATILLVGLGLEVSAELIGQAPNLKLIATATTGHDHIDETEALRRGIPIVSLKDETRFLNSITGTAELAFGLIIDLLRKTYSAFESVKNYEWDRERFRGKSLAGKTLGIVGVGRLGQMMASYGNAFGMKVIGHDPYLKEENWPDNCRRVSFEELLAQSDVISIHVHLSPETENMFGNKEFERMKKGVVIINTSRGKIVDEKDLLESLKTGHIGGYGTDVLADETSFGKTFSKHPLVEYARAHDNVIILPHIGGMTQESRVATDTFIAHKIKKYVGE